MEPLDVSNLFKRLMFKNGDKNYINNSPPPLNPMDFFFNKTKFHHFSWSGFCFPSQMTILAWNIKDGNPRDFIDLCCVLTTRADGNMQNSLELVLAFSTYFSPSPFSNSVKCGCVCLSTDFVQKPPFECREGQFWGGICSYTKV